MARGWRARQVGKAAILAAVALAAVGAELWLAPRAWEIVTYAHAYGRTQVEQGWTRDRATLLVVRTAVITLGPAIAIAAVPALVGWLLNRRM